MTRTRTPALALLSLAALAAAAGCHAYRPGTLPELRGGDRVRALLTEEQRRSLDDVLTGGRVVEGTVVEASADGVLLEVPVVTVAQGIRVDSYSQRLRLPVGGVADVEVRSLNRARTYALVGAAGAALGGLAWSQFGRARRGSEPPPQPPQEDRVVIVSIPFSPW